MQQAFKSIETALNSASTRASQIEAQNNQQGEPTGESTLLYLNEDVFNELDMDTSNLLINWLLLLALTANANTKWQNVLCLII